MSDTPFIPGPETARQFRDALGCFATGVTVVTAHSDSGPMGMTANSFTSVSLAPPLVLWSPAKSSRRYTAFTQAQHFAIHIMGEDQHSLAQHFAQNGDRFDSVTWAPSPDGVPILSGCLARFECKQTAVHDAGDHSLILGQVLRATHRTGKGLIFKQGQFGGFAGLG